METKRKPINIGAALEIFDVTDEALPYLNDRVKEALKTKVTQPIALNDDQSVKYKVTFFGTKVSIRNIGIKRIAKKLNEISENHEILGFLGGVIEYPLAPIGGNQEVMILAYIAVNADSYAKLVDDVMSFNEGGIPETQLETIEELKEEGIL